MDGIDLSVPTGSVYALIGRNGAGKTTLLHMLAGLMRPDSGEISVLGLNISSDRRNILKRVGVHLGNDLFPYLTGNELSRFNRSFYPQWSQESADKYAKILNVSMDTKFSDLSTGNKGKLSLVLTLAQGADLLILDEPTTGLDPMAIDQLIRILIEDFTANNRTILLTSQHLSEIDRLADWVGIIDQGRMVIEAALDDVRQTFHRIRIRGNSVPKDGKLWIAVTSVESDVADYIVQGDVGGFKTAVQNVNASVVDMVPMSLSEIFIALVNQGEE